MKLLTAVKKLEGQTREDARSTCKKLFARFGITEEKYGTGTNLVMRKPGKSGKEIILAAHHDWFPGSPGANDNASAVAVLLGAAHELWEKKLKHPLTVCIFDEEEKDCIGSREYVAKHGTENIKAMIDLELVGNGTVAGLWPVTGKTKLVDTFVKVCKKRKQRLELAPELPSFYADYIAFKNRGVDSTCLTMIPEEEVELIRPFVTQHPFVVGAKLAFGTLKIPPLFKKYHAKEDTSRHVSEKSLQLAKDILVAVVKELQK